MGNCFYQTKSNYLIMFDYYLYNSSKKDFVIKLEISRVIYMQSSYLKMSFVNNFYIIISLCIFFINWLCISISLFFILLSDWYDIYIHITHWRLNIINGVNLLMYLFKNFKAFLIRLPVSYREAFVGVTDSSVLSNLTNAQNAFCMGLCGWDYCSKS